MSVLRTWVCDLDGCGMTKVSYDVPDGWLGLFRVSDEQYGMPVPDLLYCVEHADLIDPTRRTEATK